MKRDMNNFKRIKKLKNPWMVYAETFTIHEDKDLFEEHGIVKVRLFRNENTGEIKIFGAQSVELKGTDKILKRLQYE